MKKENRSVLRALTMISQIGMSFITPIGLCVMIGYYLDNYFHKNYWFIFFFFLGVLTAFRNVYFLTKVFYEKDLKKENEELKYWKHLTTKDSVSDNDTDTSKE